MTPAMKLVFEAENLANASPATVSRAGIIYVSGEELGWRPVAASWLAARRPAEAAALRALVEALAGGVLAWAKGGPAPVMHNEDVNQVSTMLTILDACLARASKSGLVTLPTVADTAPDPAYERMALYAAAWGLGGLLNAGDRRGLDGVLRGLSDLVPGNVSGRIGVRGRGLGGGGEVLRGVAER